MRKKLEIINYRRELITNRMREIKSKQKAWEDDTEEYLRLKRELINLDYQAIEIKEMLGIRI